MIFVVLGIIVLVLSFVIALATLIRDQRKLEEENRRLQKEGPPSLKKLEVGMVDSGDGTTARQPVPGQEPSDYQLHQTVSQAPDAAGETKSQVDEEGVWWRGIVDKVEPESNASDDEQKSIEAIRSELAKLTTQKRPASLDNMPELGQNDHDKHNSLAGEFSPRDIKRD
ncbi:MAG: hypothetical protein AAB512_03155 [Patescibacteria group bacterium]